MTQAFYHLANAWRLGEFSIAMRGEHPDGSAYFRDDKDGTPVPAGIDVDVDLAMKKVDRISPDFFETTWGIPLFSERFMEEAPAAFAEEVRPIPAMLHFDGGKRPFFAVKLNYLRLVDPENSEFGTFGPATILRGDPAFYSEVDEFLFARDIEFRGVRVASEKMIDLIQSGGFRIEYFPYGVPGNQGGA